MQERTLVCVVEVSGIGEDAIGECGHRRICAHITPAPHARDRTGREAQSDIARDCCFFGIVPPRTERELWPKVGDGMRG